MLQSMTGFGAATAETVNAVIRVEFKSLNSRGLDLSIRLPKSFNDKEIQLRSRLSNILVRGKVNLSIEVEYTGDKMLQRVVNKPVLSALAADLKSIAQELQLSTDNILPGLLQLNDVFINNNQELSDDEWAEIENVLDKALDKFVEFRKAEGATLANELSSYVNTIEKLLRKVEAHKDKRIEQVTQSLRDKMQSLQDEGKFDSNRFEQELIYYAEKLDITEEIVRLDSHLNYFQATMNEEYPGKKLGFIAQEMGREINTIGSKANDALIQRDIVMMKEELEKIKEQVLNIL